MTLTIPITDPIDKGNLYRRLLGECPADGVLEGETKADIAILGAGFSGLATALELADRGFKVAVVEAATIGYGCSGRNGGHLCVGWTNSERQLAKRLGNREEAHRLNLMSVEAVRLVQERVKRHAIACDLRMGYLMAAANPKHQQGLQEEQRELDGLQSGETEWLDQAALRQKLDSPVYYGGLWHNLSGHLNPLAYCYGLAKAARQAGVAIYENSPVIKIDRNHSNPSLVTPKGRIRAQFLVIAGNAYLGDLLPQLSRTILPVGSYIMATDPLPPSLADSLIKGREAVVDSNWVLDYFRLDDQNRLIYGGRCTYSGKHPRDLAGFIRPRMLRVFPQLANYQTSAAWGGSIAITVDRMVDIGRLTPSIYYTQGYCGHGLATSQLMARLLAEAISGQATRFDLLANLKHPSFPGGRYRQSLLTLAMLYYRLRDMI